MRDEVKGIITKKCDDAHCLVLELDFIRGGGRLWVGPQHNIQIRDYKYRYSEWSPYIILQYRNV